MIIGARRWIALAAVLVLGTLGVAAAWWAQKPTVLRVAIGQGHPEDLRVMSALVTALGREKAAVRLKLSLAENAVDAARKVDAGETELAVIRSDAALPKTAQTAVILRREALILLTLDGKSSPKVGDLAGKRVAALRYGASNRRLFEGLLQHYDVALDSVPVTPVASVAALREAVAEGRVDAVMLLGVPAERDTADAIAAVAAANGERGGLNFVEIAENEAIERRNPAIETGEIVRGAFGGLVPRPAEAVATVTVSHRLVAAQTLADNVVGDLTRLIFQLRPGIAAELPAANGIEAPETEKGSALPVHAGAAAFLDGEQLSFFDRYGDFIYIGVMVLSVVGSGVAAMFGRVSAKHRRRSLGGLDRLVVLLAEARSADTPVELERIERAADAILVSTVQDVSSRELDGGDVAAYRLAFDQVGRAVAERRRMLLRPVATPPRRLPPSFAARRPDGLPAEGSARPEEPDAARVAGA